IEDPFGHQLAPLATLATVAAVTRRLRIGSLVLANDYRHPVILAKEVATLDVLSNGRVELGLGAGFSQSEYEQAGLRFDPPGVRVDRLEESLRVVKGLFADGPLTFAGTHYSVTGLDGFPKPVQRPHPPILIGAAGPRMLAIAGREADIVGFHTVATARGVMSEDPASRRAPAVAERGDRVRRAAGDRSDRIELGMVVTVIVAEPRPPAAERLARDRGWSGVSADQVLEMPSVFIGSPDRIAEEMQARRERFGFSYYVVLDRSIEAVAPIVARLTGR